MDTTNSVGGGGGDWSGIQNIYHYSLSRSSQEWGVGDMLTPTSPLVKKSLAI